MIEKNKFPDLATYLCYLDRVIHLDNNYLISFHLDENDTVEKGEPLLIAKAYWQDLGIDNPLEYETREIIVDVDVLLFFGGNKGTPTKNSKLLVNVTAEELDSFIEIYFDFDSPLIDLIERGRTTMMQKAAIARNFYRHTAKHILTNG